MKRRNFLKSLGVLGILVTTGNVVLNLIKKEEPILSGFKGKTFMEAGYIYVPYIPVLSENESSFIDTSNPIMNQYSKRTINPDYYTTIKL